MRGIGEQRNEEAICIQSSMAANFRQLPDESVDVEKEWSISQCSNQQTMIQLLNVVEKSV